MNEMPIVIVKLVRRLAAVVIAASVLAGLQAAQAAGSTDQAVGALAYAPQTETLYRSDGQALYRSDSSGNQWTKVPLATLPGGGRLAAVAVSAGEQSQLYVAGPGLGVLKSIDAGKSWSHVDRGLPSRDVIAFAAPRPVARTRGGWGKRVVVREESGGRR